MGCTIDQKMTTVHGTHGMILPCNSNQYILSIQIIKDNLKFCGIFETLIFTAHTETEFSTLKTQGLTFSAFS
jgi:hypothetical protein